MREITRAAVACALMSMVPASAGAAKKNAGQDTVGIDALWVDPGDVAAKDLFYGPGGRDNAPRAGATYTLEKIDKTGHSDSYHLVGPDGRKWRAKIGDEVHSEIVVSRVLWAIGYHQPLLYFVDDWHVDDAHHAATPQARFRLNSDHKTAGDWAFDRNPFVGTRELKGLLVANLVLNNWDLGDPQNNRIYEVKVDAGGKRIWYVMQDVGGSLGKSRYPIGTRSNIDDFESQGFIRRVHDGRVEFDYHGRRKELYSGIGPEDVAWACGLLARITDRQWADAFRGAGYPDDTAARYIKKIEDKIRQGTALGTAAGAS